MRLPKLPSVDVVKPVKWDFIAAAILVAALGLMGLNVVAAQGDGAVAISGTLTFLFVLGHLGTCLGGVLVLGKTGTEGTIWGNLAAVGACLAGMSGFFLSAALWATA